MRTLGTPFAVTGLVDVGFIAVQAARRTYSLFNSGTDPLNVIGQPVFASGGRGNDAPRRRPAHRSRSPTLGYLTELV